MKKIFFLWIIFFLFSLILKKTNLVWAQEPEVKEPEKVQEVGNLTFPLPYIPMLKDLNYQPDKSALFKTGNFLTGTLVFTGRYSSSSLVEFFKIQMKSQGWEEIGSFASKIIFLAFKRPEGYAFITISEGTFSTEVRIVAVLSGGIK